MADIDFLPAALAYMAKGWPVFPLKSGQKVPAVPRGVHEATPDQDKARQWWGVMRDANIGLACGTNSGIVVVDLDNKDGRNGIAEWKKLTDAYGQTPTLSSSTGGGGRHLFFQCATPPPNSKDKIGPGIEVKGDGLYVVLPPSIHPNGAEYRFDDEYAPIAPLPAWLIPAGNLAGKIDLGATPTTGGPQLDAAERCRLYLAEVPDAISGQGGHNATLRAAAECFRFGLTEGQAWDTLNWFNDTKCQPKWSEKELRHKLRQGRKVVDAGGDFGKHLENDHEAVPFNVATPAADRPPTVSTSPLPQYKRISELSEYHPRLRTPVIRGILRKGEIMNIIAAPKTGKSWMAGDLGLSIAAGKLWLGRYQTEQGNILVIDNELHPETTRDRIPQIAQARGLLPHEYDSRFVVDNIRGTLVDLLAMRPYFDAIEPGAFSVIILDAFYRFMPSDASENDNGVVAGMYNFLDRMAARLGCCFVLIHHSSKGDQSGKAVTDVGAGAGSQSRAADTHLVLRQHETDGVIVLDAVVRSWKPIEPCCLRWTFPVFNLATECDPSRLKRAGKSRREREEKPAKVVWSGEAFAAEFISEKPKTKESIIHQATKGGITNRAAHAILAEAEADGLIHKWSFARDRKVYYASTAQILTYVDSPSQN